MASAFKMSPELIAEIAAKRAELEAVKASLDDLSCDVSRLAEEATSAFDVMSERWQDGERGQAVGSWLDDLEDLAAEIGNVAESLGEFAEALETPPVEPDYS